MNIEKLFLCLAHQMELKYSDLIYTVANHLLQEIMHGEEFYNNGPKDLTTEQILTEISNNIDEFAASTLTNCALEFCVTNNYSFEGETWNCINYLLDTHADWFTAKERKYLKALNNSYLNIYQVLLVTPNKSIVLKNMIEQEQLNITVFDKSLSKSLEKGQYIAIRALKKDKTSQDQPEYESAASVMVLPDQMVEECISSITHITGLMSNPMSMKLFAENSNIKDDEHNMLLIKKMWTKEIAECWYSYYSNIEILDFDGNPLNPCTVEFDLTAPKNKIIQFLKSSNDFIRDGNHRSLDTWLLIDKTYIKPDSNSIKKSLPDLDKAGKDTAPIYNGKFVTNGRNSLLYRVLGELILKKNKLLIEVDSFQRANIIQDEIETQLKGMVSNPQIKRLP